MPTVSLPEAPARNRDPRGPADISPDELEVVNSYRRAKHLGYADLLICVQNGARVKLWLTMKMR